MKNFLIIKPSFDNGNVGDTALIKTIISLFKSNKIYIPQTKGELNNINSKLFESLIYFGNDCVPYYPGCIPIKQIMNFLKVNKKVHIINTSWGEKSKGINIIKSVAQDPNFHIYMRDQYSHKLIQRDIQFHNTPVLTADLAFLCKKNTNIKVDKLEQWMNKNDKPIIGINTHNDFKQHNNDVKNELKKFITTNKDTYRYLFIPHDSRKKEYEDLQTLCRSCNNIDGFTTNYLDPEYEKYITSRLYLVITGRMHLSILTIPNGIPSIAISYNGLKAKGSFQHYGLENFVIEPSNINALHSTVNYIKTNYTSLQNTIKNNTKKIEDLIYTFVKTIKE